MGKGLSWRVPSKDFTTNRTIQAIQLLSKGLIAAQFLQLQRIVWAYLKPFTACELELCCNVHIEHESILSKAELLSKISLNPLFSCIQFHNSKVPGDISKVILSYLLVLHNTLYNPFHILCVKENDVPKIVLFRFISHISSFLCAAILYVKIYIFSKYLVFG